MLTKYVKQSRKFSRIDLCHVFWDLVRTQKLYRRNLPQQTLTWSLQKPNVKEHAKSLFLSSRQLLKKLRNVKVSNLLKLCQLSNHVMVRSFTEHKQKLFGSMMISHSTRGSINMEVSRVEKHVLDKNCMETSSGKNLGIGWRWYISIVRLKNPSETRSRRQIWMENIVATL